MLFSFAVKTALKIIDGVLDILVPTDLQRIELKPRTFRPGQSVAVSGTAYFSCQEDFVGGSIQTVVGIILDGAFEALPAKPPATVKQAVADKIAEILISKGVDMITDGVTDEFFGAGGPLFADVPVPYDPRSFDGGLVSMLARAMPDGDFSGFIGQLGTWGVPLLDVDVVAVEDPAVASYEAWSGHLVGGAAAGTTRYRAWGLRFEDRALFWGLLTLAVPQGVLSEWADVVLDPNATTEPPNITAITPVSGFESDSVTFTAEVTGATPQSLTWTFGRAATPSTSTDTAPRVTLGPVRVYTVTVRATNEYGEDERSFVLTVLKRGNVPGWVLVPAAPSAAPILAGGVRILVVDGYPAIFYGARYGGDLMMVRALDTQGRAWGTPVSVVPASEWYDAAFSVGLVDGRPAIAHAAKVGSNAAIEYRRALDTGGAAWGASVTVAGPWSFSSETSLMVTGDRPGVIYRNPDTRRVTWQCAIDADGTAFGAPVIVADEGASENVRGAAIAGNPAVVWVVGRQLHWARAIDTTGSEWGPSLTVYDLGSSSTSQLILEGSLVDVGGAPSVSFFTRLGPWDPSQLGAIRATNATGDVWSYAGTIDPGIDARFSQSAWCGGRPAIVYEASSTLMERRLLWADFAAGDSWPAPMVIDTTGGGEPGIADVLGRPVIAFVQDTTNTLIYAFFDPWVER
jgi:PKD repeat protein